jgi:hypothetical protein
VVLVDLHSLELEPEVIPPHPVPEPGVNMVMVLCVARFVGDLVLDLPPDVTHPGHADGLVLGELRVLGDGVDPAEALESLVGRVGQVEAQALGHLTPVIDQPGVQLPGVPCLSISGTAG